MKQNKMISNDEELARVLVSTYKYVLDSTFLFASFKGQQYKFKQLFLYEEHEPLKIFKKRHNVWEDEKRKLYNLIYSQVKWIWIMIKNFVNVIANKCNKFRVKIFLLHYFNLSSNDSDFEKTFQIPTKEIKAIYYGQ